MSDETATKLDLMSWLNQVDDMQQFVRRDIELMENLFKGLGDFQRDPSQVMGTVVKDLLHQIARHRSETGDMGRHIEALIKLAPKITPINE